MYQGVEEEEEEGLTEVEGAGAQGASLQGGTGLGSTRAPLAYLGATMDWVVVVATGLEHPP